MPPSPFFVLMLATCARSRSDAAPAHPSPPGPTLLRRNRGGYAAVSGSAPIGDQRHLLRRRAGSLRRRRPHAEALIPTAGVPKTPYVHSWHRGPRTAGHEAASGKVAFSTTSAEFTDPAPLAGRRLDTTAGGLLCPGAVGRLSLDADPRPFSSRQLRRGPSLLVSPTAQANLPSGPDSSAMAGTPTTSGAR